MKNLLASILVFSFLLACETTDVSGQTDVSQLLGDWTLDNIVRPNETLAYDSMACFEGTPYNFSNGLKYEIEEPEEPSEFSDFSVREEEWTISDSGQLTISRRGNEPVEYFCDDQGDIQAIKGDGFSIYEFEGTWSVADNVLTIRSVDYSPSQVLDFRILKLSEERFSLELKGNTAITLKFVSVPD